MLDKMTVLRMLVWLLCAALVRGGFHYPHDIMVKDEETGGTSREDDKSISTAKYNLSRDTQQCYSFCFNH